MPEPADHSQPLLVDTDRAAIEAAAAVASSEVELEAIVTDDGVWGDEERRVAEFMAGGCSCNHGFDGSPCNGCFLLSSTMK